MEEIKEKTNVDVQKSENKGTNTNFSVISFILGIVSLVFFFVSVISVPCAVLAVIFAVLDKKINTSTMSVAGLVLGIITLALYVVILITCLIIGSTFPGIVTLINSLISLCG
jgi:hypothetical protein